MATYKKRGSKKSQSRLVDKNEITEILHKMPYGKIYKYLKKNEH